MTKAKAPSLIWDHLTIPPGSVIEKGGGQLFGTTPPRTPPDFALPTVLLGPPMLLPDPALKTSGIILTLE